MQNVISVNQQRPYFGGTDSTVLVISYKRENHSMYAALLSKWRHRVELAKNTETVLKSNKMQTPNVILMDLGFDFGNELINICRLKEKFSSVPIITISTFPHTKCRSTAFSVGVSDYLVKPIDYDYLKKILKDYTEYTSVETTY